MHKSDFTTLLLHLMQQSLSAWEIQYSILVCLSSPDRDVLLSSLTERPHQRPGLCSDNPEASPFTFSWNDLTSTFLLSSAFIHIWGWQWTFFSNLPHVDASYDSGLTHGRNIQTGCNSNLYSHFQFHHLQQRNLSKSKCTGWLLLLLVLLTLLYENMTVGLFLADSACFQASVHHHHCLRPKMSTVLSQKLFMKLYIM